MTRESMACEAGGTDTSSVVMEPFRTALLHCPRCRGAELTSGELRHCAKCNGTWVPHEVLAEHVSTMQVDVKPKLVWEISNARLGLPCAACTHRMEPLRLFDVPVDRCHSHGVWFDKDELATVLQKSAVYVEPNPEMPAEPQPPRDNTALAFDVAAGALEFVLTMLGEIFTS